MRLHFGFRGYRRARRQIFKIVGFDSERRLVPFDHLRLAGKSEMVLYERYPVALGALSREVLDESGLLVSSPSVGRLLALHQVNLFSLLHEFHSQRGKHLGQRYRLDLLESVHLAMFPD